MQAGRDGAGDSRPRSRRWAEVPALPLSGGALGLNHLDGWQAKSGSAKVTQDLGISTDERSVQADRPWRSVRDDVKRAWIDGSFATVVTELGMANFDHFLRNMHDLDDMTRTEGVELISGSGPQGDLP